VRKSLGRAKLLAKTYYQLYKEMFKIIIEKEGEYLLRS